jgi:RNA ligase (TIGR02306 family)
MARQLASIQKILTISPIEKADTLELATVLGWQCVVKKGEFVPGDLVVYFEVDSFLPIHQEFEFLRKNCYKNHPEIGEGFRLRTIRLRGEISQGLVLPLRILESFMSPDEIINDVTEGTDVTDIIGVRLYAPPVPACLKGEVKGGFPSFMPKTDETRVQVLQKVLTRYEGVQCYVTEKIDGTSVSYYLRNGEFGVCSRNLELKETDNAYWQVAKKYDIESKMRNCAKCTLLKNFAIQGEIYGLGLQGNSLKLSELRVAFFNVFDIDNYKYLEYHAFKFILNECELETVPIIEENFILIDDIPALLKKAEGMSKITPTLQREGIVIRPIEEKLDLEMSQGMSNARVSFKAVSQEYLLTHEE